MGIFSTVGHWRRKLFLWVGLPVIAVIAIYNGAADIGPSWKARNGEGVSGMFTATHEVCRRRSCTMHGTFESTDGSVRRDDLILRDAGDSLQLGESAPALDSGGVDSVFPRGGGGSGLWVSLGFLMAGLAAIAAWVFMLVKAIRRPTTARETAPV